MPPLHDPYDDAPRPFELRSHYEQRRDDARRHGNVEWLVAPVVLAPIFALLYPLTTAATLAAAYAVAGIVDALHLGRNVLGIVAVLAAAIAVCWTVGRLDQRLAAIRPYRIVRHVLRLVSVALVANAAMLSARGLDRSPGFGAFFGAMFTDPTQLAAWVLFVVVAHWVIASDDGMWRLYWNAKLVMWHFRPEGSVAEPWRGAPAPLRQAPIPMPGQFRRPPRGPGEGR